MTQATSEPGQQGVGQQASAKAQEAASVAQEKASELREHGSTRLRNELDQRSNQAGSQMRSLAEALRRSGNDLDNQGNVNASQLTGQAADRIERLGSYLKEKSGDELMGDIEAFARRRPWMLAGLGMLAGVAAARFMKASSEERYGTYRRTGRQSPTGPGLTGGRVGAFEQAETGRGSDAGDALDEAAARNDDAFARDPYAGRR